MTKCYGHEECEYNAQPNCALPDGMECPHGVKADKPAAESWTDIEALIERLNQYSQSLIAYQMGGEFADVCMDAATALSTLQAENEEMQKQLNIFSEFLCYMTGGLLSETNYTAQEMVTAAEDYQQSVCDDCDKVNVIGNDELIDEVQAIQDKNEKLRAENSILRKMQPVELSGESARTFALAMEVSELQAKVDQERAHRIHAEQHADAFLKDCERLNAELERVTAERDAAVKDIWAAKWISCKYGTGCDFISARTGCPDCAGCGDWEWRGIKEED